MSNSIQMSTMMYMRSMFSPHWRNRTSLERNSAGVSSGHWMIDLPDRLNIFKYGPATTVGLFVSEFLPLSTGLDVSCSAPAKDDQITCALFKMTSMWDRKVSNPPTPSSANDIRYGPFSDVTSEKGPYLISLADDGVGGLETFRSHMDVILKRAQVIWSSFAGALQETSNPVDSGKNSDTKSPTVVAGPYLKMLSLSGRSIIQCPEDTPALFLSKDVRFRQCGENMLRMYIIVDICMELDIREK